MAPLEKLFQARWIYHQTHLREMKPYKMPLDIVLRSRSLSINRANFPWFQNFLDSVHVAEQRRVVFKLHDEPPGTRFLRSCSRNPAVTPALRGGRGGGLIARVPGAGARRFICASEQRVSVSGVDGITSWQQRSGGAQRLSRGPSRRTVGFTPPSPKSLHQAAGRC